MVLQKPKGLPFVMRARQRAKRGRIKLDHAPVVPSISVAASGPIYSCPLSSLPFSGQCPVQDCPGNKPGFETGGCLYLFYGRTKLDYADVAFSYKLNDKKLQDAISHGQERVLRAVGFYKTLNDVRNEDMHGYCPHCGVGHQSGIFKCQNTALCADRQSFADMVLENSHLNYYEIQGTRRDVYRIVREWSRFQKLAQSTHTNINEVLGVRQNVCQKLSETVGVV